VIEIPPHHWDPGSRHHRESPWWSSIVRSAVLLENGRIDERIFRGTEAKALPGSGQNVLKEEFGVRGSRRISDDLRHVPDEGSKHGRPPGLGSISPRTNEILIQAGNPRIGTRSSSPLSRRDRGAMTRPESVLMMLFLLESFRVLPRILTHDPLIGRPSMRAPMRPPTRFRPATFSAKGRWTGSRGRGQATGLAESLVVSQEYAGVEG